MFKIVVTHPNGSTERFGVGDDFDVARGLWNYACSRHVQNGNAEKVELKQGRKVLCMERRYQPWKPDQNQLPLC